MKQKNKGTRIHSTAIIEGGVRMGPGTSVWDNVHIRKNAKIGRQCIIGEKTYIAYEVSIGNFVKIKSHAYICAGVEIEDYVMVSAGVVFSNDKFPRAGFPGEGGLQTSEPTEETLKTVVRRGATIGANATLGPGIEIGAFAMVGMGAVVTKDVPPHALAYGNPARVRGMVCACGSPLPFDSYRKIKVSARKTNLRCCRCRKYYLVF